MKRKNTYIFLTICMLFISGCKCETSLSTENGINDEKNISQETSVFDYAELGIDEYEYDNEFKLNDNLESAIDVMASYSSFNNNSVDSEKWEDWFIDNFIVSMFDGYDYKKRILHEQNGIMTKTQAEYIQYSLTGKYNEIDLIDEDAVDCTENEYSPLVAYNIDDYTYEYDDDKLVLHANCNELKKGSNHERKYLLTVVLVKNPYSCFDGYSIESIDKEDVTETVYGDGEIHTVEVYFSGIDYSEDIASLDYCNADDDIEYSMFITVHVDDEQMQYLLENENSKFMIDYELTEDIPIPVSEINALKITKMQ